MKRILVIEDDTSYCQMLQRALEEEGYKVITAPNGDVGIRLFYEQRCELVITDIFMPEKEGLETIRELKQTFPTLKIIAISGGGLKSSYAGVPGAETALEVAKAFGANRVLFKPFEIQNLLIMVEELLQSV